jgi:gliding motility-associated protein GldM
MAGGKETPRQKMIGMMYLVLLALLAMNVSKSILDSFIIINDGLERTNENFRIKNEYQYGMFDKAKLNDPEKVLPYWKKAYEIKALADDLDKYISDLKAYLISQVDEIPIEMADTISLWNVKAKDQYDKPTTLMIGSDVHNLRTGDFTAVEFKERIEMFNASIRSKLDAEMLEKVDPTVRMDPVKDSEGKEEPWEVGNFYHLPLVSIITNLTRYQTEVRNVEAEVVKALYAKIGADDFSFDTLAVKVIPTKGSYIMIGDTYKAEVIVAAYSTTQDPLLEIGKYDTATESVINPDTTKVKIKGGIATYSVVPTTPGNVEWGGVIKIKKPNGTYAAYPFQSEYMAAKPNLVVSPTKMNVFYRGLDNPIDVSVPGIPSEKLQVNVSNATSKGSAGKFEVRPGNEKTCMVNVTADMGGGKKQTFPPLEFRVKPVPPPNPKIGGKTGSFKENKNVLANAGVIAASLDDFLFDLQYIVTSFKMVVSKGGRSADLISDNNRLTPEMINNIKAMSSGSNVIFKDIMARRLPDGRPEPLPGNLVIEIQ